MIAIINHCYAGHLPQYATFLRYQLSSLLLHPPVQGLVYYQCYVANREDDPATWATIDRMEPLLVNAVNVAARFVQMPLGKLFRRAIGRHEALLWLPPEVQVAWLIDVDYYLGEGCLEELSQIVAGGILPPASYPAHYWINLDHATGDRLVTQADEQQSGLLTVDRRDFAQRRGRSIGGLFILRRDLARKGYVRAEKAKWLDPVDADEGFQRCRCDVQFKGSLKREGYQFEPIALPNVMRLRHSQDGRKFRMDGTQIEGAK